MTMTHDPKAGFTGTLTAGATATPIEGVEFVSETLGKDQSYQTSDGILGARDPRLIQTVPGTRSAGGDVTLEPGPTTASNFLVRALGGSYAAGAISLGDTLASFYAEVKRGPKWFLYSGLKVGEMTIEGAQGSLIKMALSLVGVEETKNDAAVGSGTPPVESPYRFQSCLFQVADVDYKPSSVKLTVNNGLDDSQFRNSETRVAIPEGMRTITAEFEVDYTSETEAIRALVGSVAGTKFEWEIATAIPTGLTTPHKIKFEMMNAVILAAKPNIGGRGEIISMTVSVAARATASVAALITTVTAAA